MKIESLEIIPLQGREQGAYGRAFTTVARIRTNEGLTGYGETDSCPTIVKAIVEAPYHHEHLSGLAHLVLGEDPLQPAELWARMERGTLYCGRGGPMSHAMAAIDMAIWDIVGKAAARPVHSLLGERRRTHLRAYATQPLSASMAETADHARRLVDAGFTAVKFGWQPFGADMYQDEAIVRSLRQAVGPKVDLLIDCGNAFNADQALKRIERLREYDLYWLEEPLRTVDVEGYRRLAEAETGMRIAAGEQCSTPLELKQLIERGNVKVVQIDIGRFGITPAVEFIRYAESQGVKCVNHTYTLDLSLAASLHLAAIVEDPLLLECPAVPNDLRDVVAKGVDLTEGIAAVSMSPGLGVEIDEAKLEAAADRGRHA